MMIVKGDGPLVDIIERSPLLRPILIQGRDFLVFFPFIKTIRHVLYLRKNSDLRKASQVGRKVGKKCVTINFVYRVSNSKVMIRRTM